MNGWIEIFRTGRHTDSRGRSRGWTEADLDKMVATYAPADHEAPAVIGHPRDNHPAFGWVEGLRRDGGRLLAKFKQVVPAFAEMVQQGLFKKRSISVYPDGRLRHVGFLGAVPPAVPGLKDIAFAADEECFEYQQPFDQESDMNEVEQLKKQLAEEKTKREQAEKEGKEFKEKADTAEAENKKKAAEFAESQQKAKRKEIVDFVEAGVKEGKILPAWKEQGLVEFMTGLEEQGGEYEFAEGKKQRQAVWFRSFLSSFAAHPLFKEMVKPAEEKGAKQAEFEEDRKLGEEIAAYVGGPSK